MKKLIILGNFLLFTIALSAQNDYFVFIQSENNQPYYLQTNGKTHSSSAIGHLIISGLRDSLYSFVIGFPKSQFPEQVFQVRINRNDAGYHLKNLGTEGWTLFNIQTLQPIKAQQVESKKQTISYGDIRKTDVFSTLMAGLVNDSAVLYTSIAKAEPVKDIQNPVVSDTQPLAGDVTNLPETPKADSQVRANNNSTIPVIPTQTSIQVVSADPKKESNEKRDSATAVTQPSVKRTDSASKETPLVTEKKQAEFPVRDSVKTEVAALDDSAKRNIPPSIPAANQPTVVTVQTPGPDTPSRTSQAPVETKSDAWIVWFSETKTANGTEMVFYDMSVPEKIDTIRILIPKDEKPNASQQVNSIDSTKISSKADSGELKGDGEKTAAGRLIGKLFGKKEKDRPEPQEKNQSTIKVTTVEEKNSANPVDPVIKEKKEEDVAAKAVRPEQQRTSSGEKKESGNFFGKLFGRKNKNEAPRPDSTQGISSVKVSTVEAPADRSSSGEMKKDGTRQEQTTTGRIEYPSDNQKADTPKREEEPKSGAGKLFGKLFGRKSKYDEPQKDSVSSIRVTTVPEKPAMPAEKKALAVTNSDCRDFATDYDMDKLRVRMLTEDDADAQVTEARNLFKVKCVTTSQVKSLSSLFRNDVGKYKLLDAAYPFVSDSKNFKELISLLSDEYYIGRFKAMVRM